IITRAVIRYSGRDGSGAGNPIEDGAIRLTNASPNISYVSLVNNYRGLEVLGGSTPTLACNDIYNNTDFGIYNNTPETIVTAEGHWWGSVLGPTHSGNPGGNGQSVSDGVDYIPWQTFSCIGPPPPLPPGNLQASAVSQTQINLTWQDNSSDESDFHIERSPNGSTSWTEITTVGVSITSYNNTGLSCSTTYYYRVRAHRHSDGVYSSYSNVVSAATYPCTPSNLNATAVSQTQINLTWQDNSSDESEFHIERSPNGSSGWIQIATVGTNVASYNNTGLNCSTTYYYRVRAHRHSDGQFSGYSNVASAATYPCTPSNLSATAVLSTQINLTWQDNSPDETEFHIERSPDGSTGWAEIATVGANVTSYNNTGLSSDTTYYYRVRAHRHGDGAYSSYSNVASDQTPSPGADVDYFIHLPIILK
ncbi:MAG: fibronectin type III domain-containing protein, partial [Chloroflexi bacterium]